MNPRRRHRETSFSMSSLAVAIGTILGAEHPRDGHLTRRVRPRRTGPPAPAAARRTEMLGAYGNVGLIRKCNVVSDRGGARPNKRPVTRSGPGRWPGPTGRPAAGAI